MAFWSRQNITILTLRKKGMKLNQRMLHVSARIISDTRHVEVDILES